MEKRIGILGAFMVLCFVAVFIQLNNIQVFKAHSLASSPKPSVIEDQESQPRGAILSSDGVTLAWSVLAPTGRSTSISGSTTRTRQSPSPRSSATTRRTTA